MFYHYSNAKLLVNNEQLFVNSLDISLAAQTNPNYLIGNKSTSNHTPTNGLVGSLKLNYYMMGLDPIKNYIFENTMPIPFSFMGFAVNSGYLTNYSFNCSPNSTVIVNSEIAFFEDLTQLFVHPDPQDNFSTVPLNVSDATITNLPNYSIYTFDELTSISYNYTNSIKPVYYVDSRVNTTSLTPHHVVSLGQEINTDVVFSNLTGTPTFQGNKAAFRITFRNPASTIASTYLCSGLFYRKNIAAATQDYIKNTVSIKQNDVYFPVTIDGFQQLESSPTYGTVISGRNLNRVTEVWFEDRRARSFKLVNNRTIIAYLPNDAVTGRILLKGFGASIYSSGGYTLTYPNITVTGINPISGKVGDTITIRGTNFNRISAVEFSGGATGRFSVVNSEIILAQLPTSGLYSSIKVVSSGRQLTGISTEKFIPLPRLDGFSSLTGLKNDKIFLSGFGFDWVTGVYFNNIITTGFTVDSNIKITTYVPSGNIRGEIRLYGQSGVSSTTGAIFLPTVRIVGVDPTSGKAGDFMRITGHNIFDYFLHSGITITGIMVSFNGGITPTGFLVQSGLTYPVSTLTGRIPYTAKSGIIRLFQPDGISLYPSTSGDFRRGISNPLITKINPLYGTHNTNLNLSIEGENLFQITNVVLTGILSGQNKNSSLNITGSGYIFHDALGVRLNVLGYPLVSGLSLVTGFYDLYVSGAAGAPAVSPHLFQLTTG